MTTDTTSRMPSLLPTEDDVDEKSDYLEYYAKRLLEVSSQPSDRSLPPSVKKKKEKKGEEAKDTEDAKRTMKHILMKLRRQRQNMIQKYGNGDQVFELFLAICDKLKGRPPNEVDMVKRQIRRILHSHTNNNNNNNSNNAGGGGGGGGGGGRGAKVDGSAELPPPPLDHNILSHEVSSSSSSSSPFNNTEYEDFSEELDYLLEEGYDFGNEVLFSLPPLPPLVEIKGSSSSSSNNSTTSSAAQSSS